jgi:general secretion pathway protein K
LAAGESSEAIDREAFVSGQISDLQARLNVMNLVAGNGEQQLAALARFGRLFEQLGLPSHELGALQRALAQARQAAAGTPADGGDAPLLPARFDQLAWLGLAPARWRCCAPTSRCCRWRAARPRRSTSTPPAPR